MNSSHLDKDGYVNCVVCKKKKFGSEVNDCQGCGKYTCDKGCGCFVHKAGSWLCKNCQDKMK